MLWVGWLTNTGENSALLANSRCTGLQHLCGMRQHKQSLTHSLVDRIELLQPQCLWLWFCLLSLLLVYNFRNIQALKRCWIRSRDADWIPCRRHEGAGKGELIAQPGDLIPAFAGSDVIVVRSVRVITEPSHAHPYVLSLRLPVKVGRWSWRPRLHLQNADEPFARLTSAEVSAPFSVSGGDSGMCKVSRSLHSCKAGLQLSILDPTEFLFQQNI